MGLLKTTQKKNTEAAKRKIAWELKNQCSVAVSKSEQFPENGQVRLKHVALDCDFNFIRN
jgi:hypothetical protein